MLKKYIYINKTNKNKSKSRNKKILSLSSYKFS